jgi:hypothetical protein
MPSYHAAVFCVFKPCARIPWFWGLNNNDNLVKSLHFPQALTGLLPESRAREQGRKTSYLARSTEAPKHHATRIRARREQHG